MALSSGTRLGAYEITGSLGAGGMGEVYRARDTKLGRSVAIKVLPDAFAADADRVPRFEREAKVLASLNHPHIAALYGMEHGPGDPPPHFLIMELVEGETLAERLKRGALPAGEALAIAIQIADALESAHEQGIVHRDLKPANVKITPDDRVKVLDFGLAKAMDSSPAGSSPANSPTLSVMATQAGIIMGTAAYMSPEQAKGLPIDRRSDVFSFGVLLYELLSGRQPFRGDTAAEIMAAVMIRDADLSALPGGLNPRIAELIKRCLDKTPKKRWQSMGDLRVELEALAVAPHASAQAEGSAATGPLWRHVIPIVAAVAITAIVSTLATRWLTATPPHDVVKFAIPTPDLNQAFQGMALSPDGTRLVYVASAGADQRQLMLRMMGDPEPRPIAGSQGLVNSPAFSPDSQFVVFFSSSDTSLKKISVSGGSAVTLATVSLPMAGLSWDDSGILFAQSNGVQRVSANGGEPHLVVPAARGERVADPQRIDDRGSILFSLTVEPGNSGWEKAQVIVQAPDGKRQVVLTKGISARYLKTGHLVYVLGTTLMAAPFDAATGQVLGGPTPLVEGVARAAQQGWAVQLALSGNGSLAYLHGTAAASNLRTLALVDMSGKAQPLAVPANAYLHPRVSPDGRRVAVATDDGKEAAVWIYELSGSGLPRRLTFEGRNAAPIWSPDGRMITFQSDREGDRGLFEQPADGAGAARRLTKAEPAVEHAPNSWSPDGKTLLLHIFANFVSSIWTWSRDGDPNPKRLLTGARSFVTAEFSPDGRSLAYGSNELDGRSYQVFVQPFPLTGAKYQVAPITASTPVWSRDGKGLLVAFTNHIYRVDIQTAPVFVAGQPVAIKTPDILMSSSFIRHYDLMPDGKHFLAILPEGSQDSTPATPPQIEVVLNWLDEVKTKVPVR